MFSPSFSPPEYLIGYFIYKISNFDYGLINTGDEEGQEVRRKPS